MGKTVRKSFNGRNLQQMTRGQKVYVYIKILTKMCIKSDLEEIILKLAPYGQREKAFLLSSKFDPQWMVCPCPRLYTYGET